MADTSTGGGKVVVNRSMSLDGFIAGPGDAMGWIFDYMKGGVEDRFPEVMAATGAMLIGRRTADVGDRMASEPGHEPAYDGGAQFVLTHRPPDRPAPGVTYLSGDIGEAIATARRAAGGRNLELLGSDVAAQALRRGLVDEILVFVLPVLLGDGVRFLSAPDLARVNLEPVSVTPAGPVTMLRFRVCR